MSLKAQKPFSMLAGAGSISTASSNQKSNSSDEDDDYEEEGEGLDDVRDVDIADMRLHQMQRGTRNKRRGRGAKLQGLQSLDALQKTHALLRMEEGLRAILTLHTPVELSSICGCLQLKAQQKASTSIDLIVKFALKKEEFDLPTIEQVLGFMWEGALWEYLHRVGHPVHTIRVDPRRSVMEVWEKGGFLKSNGLFAPHFIAREVKKRNEWITSPDIQQRMDQIRQAQDVAKMAEKKIISEHDYTNILAYFRDMSKLRSLENSVREYLISEIEIARSRIDSGQDTAKMLREQLTENEQLFITVTDQLNEDLANAELVCKYNIRRRFEMDEAVCRLNSIIDSYIDCENDRSSPGGGVLQALRPRQVENLPPLMRETFGRLQTYRDLRDTNDDNLRFRSRCHIEEVRELRERVKCLEEQVESMGASGASLEASFHKLRYEYALSERKLARQEQQYKIEKDILWKQVLDNTKKVAAYELQHTKLKPLLKAAACHSNAFVQDLSMALLNHLRIIVPGQQAYRELQETMRMKREDVAGYFVRELEIRARREAERIAAATAKSKKSKSAKSSGRPGSAKEKDKEKDGEKSEKEPKEKKKSKEKEDDKTVGSKTAKSPAKAKKGKK